MAHALVLALLKTYHKFLYVDIDVCWPYTADCDRHCTPKHVRSSNFDFERINYCMRFKMAAWRRSTETLLLQGGFLTFYCGLRFTMCLNMLFFSAWTAAAFLLFTRAHAALTLHSSMGTTPCDVQYVVLHASISSPCVDQCSLLLQFAEPQLALAEGDSGLDVTIASTLLPTNVVTFQHLSAHRHMLQISCQAGSDCTASPKSWQVEKIGSGLLLAARDASQHPASASQARCVQEVNSTVSIAVEGKAMDMISSETDKQPGTNAVLTWLIRAAVLASVVILQLSSR